jgi:hypothetical protein
MGFKLLVIRGLKKLYAILYATNTTKQLQTIKVDSNHEHHRAGEGVGLSGESPYHIWIGARKKILEKQERSPTPSGFHWFVWWPVFGGDQGGRSSI